MMPDELTTLFYINKKIFCLLNEPQFTINFRFACRIFINFNNFNLPITEKVEIKLCIKQISLSWTFYIADLQINDTRLPTVLDLSKDFITKCRMRITVMSATLVKLYYNIPAEAVQFCLCLLLYCNYRKPDILVSD